MNSLPPEADRHLQRWRSSVPLSPPRSLALVFVVLVLIGGSTLLLPGMTHTPITPLQAFFTATSATMVTGLSVVDTGSTFTGMGQFVIAVMMQVGGVGTMAFAALAVLVSGGRPPLRTQVLVGEAIGQTSFRDLRRVIRLALFVAVAVEGAGAVVLTARLAQDFALPQALWLAVFHSVSAFNNAGFGLWPDSLTRYATDPIFVAVISLQIIIGGLGFVVLADPRLLRGRASLHSRITLAGTAVLLFGGTALFWWLEAHNTHTLAAQNLGGQAQLAWFMSVVPRTAGFNSVDVASMTPGATLLTMLLMFIGGGTGSTAGGVKVTTVVIMLAATFAVLRQRSEPVLFGRALSTDSVFRAFAVLTVSGLTLVVALLLLVLTQPLPFLDLTFEAVSAFATVGMTRGITDDLNSVGQLLIMLLMFVGRVGPLTLAYALATAAPSRVQYPKAEVYVG